MSNLNLNTISSLDTGREVDVNRVMQTVDYVGGLVIDSRDTVIVDGDDRYVLTASTVLPYTATGAGMPEGGAFVVVGDSTVRSELNKFKELYEFEGVDALISAAPPIGSRCRTGSTTWQVIGSGPILDYDDIKPLSAVYVDDFCEVIDGVTLNNDSFERASSYGVDVHLGRGPYKLIDYLHECSNSKFIGLGKSGGTVVRVEGGPLIASGIRFGKGKSGETRRDNLPYFDGLQTTWSESNFSPATADAPRYKNIGIVNCTIEVVGDCLGNAVSFYRTDWSHFDCDIVYADGLQPEVGNTIRGYFNYKMNWHNTLVEDNPNATYTFFSYWSYADIFDVCEFGASSSNAFELKHSVGAVGNSVTGYGSGDTRAVSIGYGSRNVSIRVLRALGGSCSIHSSAEFESSSGIVVQVLDVQNRNGAGLILDYLEGCDFGKVTITAKIPLTTTSTYKYVFSDDSGVTPIKNSARFVHDGNYDEIDTSVTPTRYREYRNIPPLLNCTFGVVNITCTDPTRRAINHNAPGGIIGGMVAGRMVVVPAPALGRAGSTEANAFSGDSTPRLVYSLDGVSFDKVKIKYTTPSTVDGVVNLTNANDFSGDFLLVNCASKSLSTLLLKDSNISITNDTPPTVGECLDIKGSLWSCVSGRVHPDLRVFNIRNGATYKDGFVGAEFALDIRFNKNPPTAELCVIEYDDWEGVGFTQVNFGGSSVMREDNPALGVGPIVSPLVLKGAGAPFDFSSGWVGEFLLNKSQPAYRYFTFPPDIADLSIRSRFVGEQIVNLEGDAMAVAIGATSWVLL